MKITIGGVCEPGTTLTNKTGGWRTFKPVYDYDKCIKCKLCELLCPTWPCYPERTDISSSIMITAKDAVYVPMNAPRQP